MTAKSRKRKSEDDGFTPAEVRQTALNLLARREHSVLELRQKLLQRGFPKGLIESVLERLSAEDLLSETRFAETYAHNRVDKGYGPLRIQQELRERGISDAAVSTILSDLDDFWMAKLAQVHRKRFGEKLPVDTAGRSQRVRFLRHRGFTLDQINRLFRGE